MANATKKKGTIQTIGSSELLLGQWASQTNSNLNTCQLPTTDRGKEECKM